MVDACLEVVSTKDIAKALHLTEKELVTALDLAREEAEESPDW
jgi:hypothetical protein